MPVSGQFFPDKPQELLEMVERSNGKPLHFTLHFRGREDEPITFFVWVDEEPVERVFLSGSAKARARKT
jgi:hypothetical protein